jgi:hypothetical protein
MSYEDVQIEQAKWNTARVNAKHSLPTVSGDLFQQPDTKHHSQASVCQAANGTWTIIRLKTGHFATF